MSANGYTIDRTLIRDGRTCGETGLPPYEEPQSMPVPEKRQPLTKPRDGRKPEDGLSEDFERMLKVQDTPMSERDWV